MNFRAWLLRTVVIVLLTAAFQASATAAAAPESPNPAQPNLVFFLGEGLRFDEFSFSGNTILSTPNMDRIAREGFAFRNALVVNALCLPSRATLLTGQYSHTTGAVSFYGVAGRAE